MGLTEQVHNTSILFLGGRPTELMAVQTIRNKVEISWTAPIVPPADGYLLTTDINNITTTVSTSPYTTTLPIPGVRIYTIKMMSLSQHLPGRMVEIHLLTNGEL